MKTPRMALPLLLVSIAVACCNPSPESDMSAVEQAADWDLAQEQLSLSAEVILAGPTLDERGARPSEGVTVGDTISVGHEGWNYTWKVQAPKNTKVILERLDVTRIH
jgi:hypothetical protein